jgi:hypothetical protein
MSDDWQSIAAAAVIAITVALFILRAVRRRQTKAGACGGGCGCHVKKTTRP